MSKDGHFGTLCANKVYKIVHRNRDISVGGAVVEKAKRARAAIASETRSRQRGGGQSFQTARRNAIYDDA